MRRWGRILIKTVLAGIAAFFLFYWWQPWEVDVRPRTAPYAPSPEVPAFAKGTRLLIVAAHPDDPEFYAGGTLLQLSRLGVVMRLVMVTDGDKGYYPLEDSERNRRIRRVEQAKASAAWGTTDLVWLGFPDGRVTDSPELIQAIADQAKEFRPDVVMGFDGARPERVSHADHRRTGEATAAALDLAGWKGLAMWFQTGAPNHKVDISGDWDEKRKLLAIHHSQFGDRLEFIEGLVGGRAERHGDAIGVEKAEAYRIERFPRP